MSDLLWPHGCSTPGLPVHHQLPEPAQTHVHWVGDAIQPSYPLLSPSPPAFNPSQYQGLLKYQVETNEWSLLWMLFRKVTERADCPNLWDLMDCSMPGFLDNHQLLEPAQTHVHQVGDAIQTSHPLSFPSPPPFNLSQHQGLFQWVSFLHQGAKVLEFQLQHQSFQWIFRTDFL